MAMRRALALPILTVACLAAGSSPASAAYAYGSLNYAPGTTSAGMLDVGMVLNTVAADMAGTQRNYDAAFPDDSAGGGFGGPRVATVKLSQKFGTPVVRTISAQVPSANCTPTSSTYSAPTPAATHRPYSPHRPAGH